jgi:hypothetical protein
MKNPVYKGYNYKTYYSVITDLQRVRLYVNWDHHCDEHE